VQCPFSISLALAKHFQLYIFLLRNLSDDGKDKPVPKPRVGKAAKKSKGKKEEPVPAVKPQKAHGHGHGEHMACLMRAKLHNRKISTVVSKIRALFILLPNRNIKCKKWYAHC
jgi:hypothetical protein